MSGLKRFARNLRRIFSRPRCYSPKGSRFSAMAFLFGRGRAHHSGPVGEPLCAKDSSRHVSRGGCAPRERAVFATAKMTVHSLYTDAATVDGGTLAVVASVRRQPMLENRKGRDYQELMAWA